MQIWTRLAEINALSLQTRTMGAATGSVVVEKEGQTLLFHETGHWESGLTFYNTLRWEKEDEFISLSHLRFGKEQPVALLQLKRDGEHRFSSVNPHFCNRDSYEARLEWDSDEIRLFWQISGPAKNEQLVITYTRNELRTS